MLPITVPSREMYDERTNTFFETPCTVLNLEHSLLSLRKWESKWKIPFLSDGERTQEQSIDYIKCMTLNKGVNPLVYLAIDRNIMNEVQRYIDDPMTATTFSDSKPSSKKQKITAEIIYYWMVSFRIPFEAQKWHLNQLLTLIKVCEIKNAPKKRMSRRDVIAQNKALNEARKRQYGTSG